MPETKSNPFYTPTLKRPRNPSPETTRVDDVPALRVPLMDITPLVLREEKAEGAVEENDGYEGEDEEDGEAEEGNSGFHVAALTQREDGNEEVEGKHARDSDDAKEADDTNRENDENDENSFQPLVNFTAYHENGDGEDDGADADAESSFRSLTAPTVLQSGSGHRSNHACIPKTTATCVAFLASRNCLPAEFDGDLLGSVLQLAPDAPIEELAAALIVLEREVERLQDEFVRRLREDVVQGRSAQEALEELGESR